MKKIKTFDQFVNEASHPYPLVDFFKRKFYKNKKKSMPDSPKFYKELGDFGNKKELKTIVGGSEVLNILNKIGGYNNYENDKRKAEEKYNVTFSREDWNSAIKPSSNYEDQSILFRYE